MLVILLTGNGARAQDLISERAWLEDASRSLTLAQVQQMPFQPYEGVLSQGYGEAAIWLRLRVEAVPATPATPQGERLVLRIRPAYLDDIQVFDSLAPNGLAGIVGDRHHPRADQWSGLDFLLPLAPSAQPRTIWVRVVSTSTRQIAVDVLRAQDYFSSSTLQQLLASSYIGIVLALTLWATVSWVFHREQVVGAYAIHQGSGLVYGLTSLGFARVLWPQEWPASWLDQAGSVASILAVAWALYFNVKLTREFGLPGWMRRTQDALLLLQPAKLVLLAFSPIIALRINMVELLLAPFLFLVATTVAQGWHGKSDRPDPVLPRGMVQSFYAVVVVLLVVAALPGLGLMRGGTITLYLSGTHSLITGLLLLFMLQYRAVRMNRQQGETLLALQRSQLQAEREQEIREEQGKLLTMLAHELKTPLATMHMRLDASAPGSREIKHAISDMNNVIDRCVQAAQLGDRRLVARPARVHVDALVRSAAAACSDPARIQLSLQEEVLAHTDPQLLSIVVSNLLENACKYAAVETPIQVRLGDAESANSPDRVLRLEITNRIGDAGAPDTHSVFQKFYRGAHARRKAGTGLGLFLVRSLVQTLGGSIEYRPDPASVRFVVDLPAASPTT